MFKGVTPIFNPVQWVCRVQKDLLIYRETKYLICYFNCSSFCGIKSPQGRGIQWQNYFYD